MDSGARILGLTGAIFLGCALGRLSRKYAPATLLGITVLVLVLFAYLPLTISKACDVANGLSYLAIHFALARAAFFRAGALPAAISEPAAVLEIQRSSVRQPSGSLSAWPVITEPDITPCHHCFPPV